jgi:hypothetical protein
VLGKIFIYWLGILPIWVFNYRFEEPKVFLFLIGGLCLSIYWITRFIKSSKSFDLKRSDLWFLGWIVILTVSSIIGVHPIDSILGGSYRHQGVLFFLTLFLLGKTIESLDKNLRKKLGKIVATVVLFEFGLITTQYLFGHVYFGKPLGTIGEANAVVGFLAIGSTFVFENFPKWVVFGMPISVLIMSSRSGALSFLAFFIGFFSRKIKPMILIALAAIALLYVVLVSLNKNYSRFEDRQIYWKLAASTISVKPILGYGAETGERVFEEAYKKSGFPLSKLIIDRSHNLFLDVFMWSGLLGLITFTGWLVSGGKDLKDLSRRASFFAFLTYSFFQPLSIVHWLLLTLILKGK